jgi:hypothetical protein
MTKIFDWIKANMMLAIGIAVVLVVFIFGKTLKKLLFKTHRVKHRRRTMRKHIPRSVGMHRGNGYPKVGGGTIPFVKNKDGSTKKAWQVAGTVAAKSRMSRLRKSR